jgi:uncharacterized protein YjiS (DUF1127 family)
MAFMTETRSAAGLVSGWLGRFRATIADWYAGNRLYRRTLAELQALDDRELADLGITRADIPALARQALGGN